MNLNETFIYHWHTEVGIAFFIASAIWASTVELTMNQWLILVNFWTFLVHQFEEYHWPGWFAQMMNYNSSTGEVNDRYPFNRNNSAWGNQIFRLYYFLPVLYPNNFFLSVGVILINITQVFGHCIYMNFIKLGQLYDPGAFTALFGHLPITILFLQSNFKAIHMEDLGFAFLYLAGFFVVLILVELKLLAAKDSKYPFTAEEIERFYKAIGKPHKQ